MAVFAAASFGANTMLYFIIERMKRRTLSRVAYTFMIFCCFCLTLSFYAEEQRKAALVKGLHSSNSSLINSVTNEMKADETTEATLHINRLNDIYNKYGIDVRNISIAAVKATKPKEVGNLRIWLGIILKYAISTCFHTMYVLSVESFPTTIRQLSVGTCSVASRLGSIVAPFTKELVSSTFSSFEITPI